VKALRFIVPYFGKWPPWFPAFVLTAAHNSTVEWILFTDCQAPKSVPPNMRFVQMPLPQLNQLASSKLGLKINKGPYSQCDMRPAFGVIFDEYLKDAEFWGHCDLDVIWGDLRTYLSPNILNNYQIITNNLRQMAGHLGLYRNCPEVNNFFRQAPDHKEILEDPQFHYFDEDGISNCLKENNVQGIYWDRNDKVHDRELKYLPTGWYWKRGRIFDRLGRQYGSMHFMLWKKHMKHIDFDFGDRPEFFRITRAGLWSKPMPMYHRFLEAVPITHRFARFRKRIKTRGGIKVKWRRFRSEVV